MKASISPTTRSHLSFGVLCFSILALLQGLIELVVLMIRFNGHIFRPQDIFRVQLFSFLHWLLDLSKYASLPLILDTYLGPRSTDKAPLILRLLGIYEIAFAMAGILFALILSIFFKVRKKTANHMKLLNLYFWSACCFFISFNLLSALIPTELNDSFPLFVFLCGLVISIVFLALVPIRFIHLRLGTHFSNRWLNGVLFLPVIFGMFSALVMISNLRQTATVVPSLHASSTHIQKPKTNPSRKPTNVVLISIDTLRADHLGCYGYFRNTSPNIDALAKEGIIFKDAFSVSTWTLPSHMSMMTSLYPEANGVVSYEDSLSEEHLTLAEILQQDGFQASAFVSGQYVNSIYGFNQGFSLYDDFSIDTRQGDSTNAATSQKLNIQIERWLDTHSQKDFFLFLHYFDVHSDYDPPPPYDKLFDPGYQGSVDGRGYRGNPGVHKGMNSRDLEHIIALYDGEIAFTDEYIGRFFSKLKRLGIYDDTLIIVTSDHGEAFFEHGIKGHSSLPYEELIRVPLIIKFPTSVDHPRGSTFPGQASILDIMPTILDVLGLKSARPLEGQSLLPVMRGSKMLDNRNLYFVFEKTQYAVRTGAKKLLVGYDEQFSVPQSKRNLFEQFSKRYGMPWKRYYDLTADEKEKKNLLQHGKSKLRSEANRELDSLLNWLNYQRTIYYSVPQRSGKRKMEPDEEEEERLRALQYFQ